MDVCCDNWNSSLQFSAHNAFDSSSLSIRQSIIKLSIVRSEFSDRHSTLHPAINFFGLPEGTKPKTLLNNYYVWVFL